MARGLTDPKRFIHHTVMSRFLGLAARPRLAMRLDWLSIRYRLEYLAFRAAARLFLALGLERASNLSGGLWRRFAPLFKRHKRALGQLGLAFPEKSEVECEAICRGMWENLGRNFAEAFFLRQIAEEGRVQYEDTETLEHWVSMPGGKVACAAHLANWELVILQAGRRGLRPWSIYQRIKNPLVDRDVVAMRSFLYTGGLVAKSASLPRQFLRLVRDGGTTAFLADLRDNNGVEVPFFGRPAPSTTFPALLAQAAGTPILVTCLRRLPGVRFVQTFELVDVPDTGDRRADLAAATASVQAVFEAFIREAPEQWMWAHRRWG